MQSRREFLKSSTLIAAGTLVPTFLARTAWAAKGATKDTILVVVQLTGGNDGLNTVIPFKDDTYYKLRPTIAIPKDQVKKVNDSVGLHPSLDGLAGLLEDKALCVVQGVGYPNPSQSHFRSMDIWQAASTAESLTEGWIGRALKGLQAPAFHVSGENDPAPLALTGAPARVPSIRSIEEFQLKMNAASGAERQGQKSLIEAAAKGSMPEPKPGLLDFVRKTALNTYASSQRLQEIGRNYEPKAPYPGTPLANRLRLCAQLIDAELGARIFYVSLENFDTHANQGGIAGTQAQLLGQLSGAVTAFYKDLAARGHKDRVLVMTFSEFGRRAAENGSKGTDHGSGAPMFLVGGKVKAGLVGEHPSLTKLEDGNLKHAIDFRTVYAAVLEQWLGVPRQNVVGDGFTPAGVFA